jgi:hypothetical protein
MINSALERQAKSTNELLHRLVEEQVRKNLILLVLVLLLLVLLVLVKPIHIQVVKYFHSRTTIEGLAPFGVS